MNIIYERNLSPEMLINSGQEIENTWSEEYKVPLHLKSDIVYYSGGEAPFKKILIKTTPTLSV